MTVKNRKELIYLLGEQWHLVRVEPKKRQRDFGDYTISFPVILHFKPSDGFFLFVMESMKMHNMMGKEQWNTKYANKKAPVLDGEVDLGGALYNE